MREVMARFAFQHIGRTSDTAAGNVEVCLNERQQKSKEGEPMYAYCSREKFLEAFWLSLKLLKIMVARDGIEPPTPAFSGPRSTN